jgi:hypothetical protein
MYLYICVCANVNIYIYKGKGVPYSWTSVGVLSWSLDWAVGPQLACAVLAHCSWMAGLSVSAALPFAVFEYCSSIVRLISEPCKVEGSGLLKSVAW